MSPIDGNEFSRTATASPVWSQAIALGTRFQARKGAVIMPAGEPVEQLYYIESGEIRMENIHESGIEKTYWYIGEKSLFGETPFFHRMKNLLSAVCTRETVYYVFSRRVLYEKVFPQYPELLEDILYNMAVKIRVLTNQIATLSMDDLASRLCKYFQLHLNHDAQGTLYTVPGINQQALANLLGVHRVTCNRVLRDLEKKGIISEYSAQRINILDEEFFRRCAGTDFQEENNERGKA